MGLSSRRAFSNASSLQGYQSTGLCACCCRYGLFSATKRLDNSVRLLAFIRSGHVACRIPANVRLWRLPDGFFEMGDLFGRQLREAGSTLAVKAPDTLQLVECGLLVAE